MHICDYGCGKEAKYQFKNGKWCCSKRYQSCPYYRKKRSLFRHIDETKEKISKSKKGKESPLKGKKLEDIYGKEKATELKKINSESRIGKSWDEIHGVKKSKKLRKKQSERIKKNIDTWHWSNRKNRNEILQKIIDNHSQVNEQSNPNWKGGYHINNIATYDFYYNKLTIDEEAKRGTIDSNVLTVICTNCKRRFVPTLKEVQERVRALLGKNYGEQRLYCSEECKNSCSIYNKHSYQENHPKKVNKQYTQEEYNQFRDFVLERDNYKCQYCGKQADHVHHERPQKLEPFFSLDPDLAWSVCKKCHYEKGHQNECSTGSLSSIICK